LNCRALLRRPSSGIFPRTTPAAQLNTARPGLREAALPISEADRHAKKELKKHVRGVRTLERKAKKESDQPATEVRRGLSALLSKIREAARQAKDAVGAEQLRRFVKVTKNWWGGWFHCYDSPDIPRTTNDLEHRFGSHRYPERRASGRKQASPGLVVQGAVRVVASLATR
jgi:ElaB/YqjD/DUF883 family membrane-anchored ribosome-binding protein